MTAVSELKPDAYYWVRRRGESAWEIVQISTVFGEERDFWTVARMGSDLHGMLEDFEYGSEIARPAGD